MERSLCEEAMRPQKTLEGIDLEKAESRVEGCTRQPHHLGGY
jgi:hypothetical protein